MLLIQSHYIVIKISNVFCCLLFFCCCSLLCNNNKDNFPFVNFLFHSTMSSSKPFLLLFTFLLATTMGSPPHHHHNNNNNNNNNNNDPWASLAEIIANNSLVIHQKTQLTTNINSFSNVGMDCLQVVYAPGSWGDLVGVFHVSPGNGPNQGTHSQLYVATARSGNWDNWTVTANGTPYSNSGSMGFIYIDSPTGNAFLAYELEGDGGNTISIRKYNSIVGLVGGGGYDEWQLSKENNVHVAASPDTWGENTYNSIVNVGTPSISVVDGGDVIIRHHYCPDGVHDYPSKGLVSLGGGGGGVVSNWGHWQGFFANWVNDVLRSLGAQGKIGGRDSITWGGSETFIFEAQLTQDDWSSWRPFLLVPAQRESFALNLDIDGTHTYANPHMVFVPKNLLLQTYFIPGERDGNLPPGTLLRITEIPQEVMDDKYCEQH